MHKIGRVVAAALAGVVAAAATAQDAVQWRVEDGGNGHWYAVVQPGGTWTTGHHAAAASAAGATLAAFESTGEWESVRSLLAQQLANVPSGEDLMIHAIGFCGDCQAYWRGGVPVSEGWAAGEPSQQAGYFIVQFDASTQSLVAAADELESGSWTIWEWEADCNSNGVVDYGEIIDARANDSNANGIPDLCDAYEETNLIENGSFEANPVNQCCTTTVGWTGYIDLVWIEWFADDGGISIDLNTGSAGMISQTINVDKPGLYRLSFSMAGNNCGTSPALKQMRVTLGPFSEVFEHQLFGEVELAEGWSHFTRDIDLPAGTHQIRFESLIGGCGGPAIDAVSLRVILDCNRDGQSDSEQIRDGELIDEDENGVPDCCEGGCPGDLNGDDAIGPPDLGILLAVWGTDGGKIAGADLNDDGTVNAADLGLLIGAWGDCGCN